MLILGLVIVVLGLVFLVRGAVSASNARQFRASGTVILIAGIVIVGLELLLRR